MGATEDAVDAAANFVGPFVDKSGMDDPESKNELVTDALLQQALSHLQTVNTADLEADPDAPYDASLAGVVYALLDIITFLGILPHLTSGVAFSQRPQSVLTTLPKISGQRSRYQLSNTIMSLIAILEQKGSGVQPLLSQRSLPDLISGLAELSFSPESPHIQSIDGCTYERIIKEIPTSRLLPIFTTFLQQPLPAWLKPVISHNLAMIPLRPHGVRHMIEFLALSYLSKTSRIPHDADGSQSQIPIPLEAVTQASRLLILPPTAMSQEHWLTELAPQLHLLLDGTEGPDLGRAAGQIIAGGILSKRATGAPGTVGWRLFAHPILQKLDPGKQEDIKIAQTSDGNIFVQEQDLETALSRLSIIVLSYSHAGIIRRLVGPVLLPLWALFNYAQSRPAMHKKWTLLPKNILSRYLALACDPKQVDNITKNLFWDGTVTWNLAPGSHGGVEIRRRFVNNHQYDEMSNILTRIGTLDTRIRVIVSLLAESKTPDDAIGTIFLQTTKRWLSPAGTTKPSLTDITESDPLAALTDAKLSEALANKFKDQFARSPQHIIELMGQLLSSFIAEHQAKSTKLAESSRNNYRNIVKKEEDNGIGTDTVKDTTDEDLASFAISILSTLVSSHDFQQTPGTRMTLTSIIVPLVYLTREHAALPISPLITSSANALLQLLQPTPTQTQTQVRDPVAEYRATLKTVLTDITSPEPPNRTWALNTLHKLITNPIAFPIVDIPSTAHLLLSASLADPESYVHISAVPVLVDLAIRAPNPTVTILVDSFIDIDERSLKFTRGKQTDEKERELQHALDFRLRVGEVLNDFVLADAYWHSAAITQHKSAKQIAEACLSLSSRRGARTQTLETRTNLAQEEHARREEGEAAWGGPVPNLLHPNGEDTQDQVERDALLKIVQGWEDTGMEEDVRIRASALSVLSTLLEHRLDLFRQVSIDAAMQMVLLILTMETSEAKGILRRAAVLVIMSLLRGLDTALESGHEVSVGLGMGQQEEIERMIRWVRDGDIDALVRDHAANVLEGMETLRMKKLYQVREQGLRLGPDLGLGENLRGLDVQPDLSEREGQGKRLMVEEVE